MTLTRMSLGNPVAVAVAVLLLTLFGLISLARLPVQLTPEVDEPEITITTNWRTAAPEEVEAEIVEPQEDAMRGLPGAIELLAQASRGRGTITITFAVGTDLRRALLEVLNRLNRVPSYPPDADEPVISAVGGDARPIAWFIVKTLPGNDVDIAAQQDFIEEVVQARFERVPGVAQSEVFGGREKELRITFDPYRAATLGVELPDVIQLIGADDISAGFADVGKRRYTVRYTGGYTADDFGELIVDWRDGRPIYLRDVADIAVQLQDRTGFVIQNGQSAIAVNAQRETGVNVLQVMGGLKQAVEELRAGPLARAQLSIEQVYDETIYIDRSVAMVASNLGLGILLATGVLWWFLRKLRATLMVSLAIPVCIIGSFILLNAAGRTLNVISLAGLAFAVGMVLDAAIVVLENVVRLRERGKNSLEASLSGTTQVWGALLASTATTVAIFLPVVFLQDEAGQLFADLALTIAVAVIFSLLVAVTVLPTAAMTWLKHINLHDPHASWWRGMTAGIMTMTGPRLRWVWIVVLLTVPLAVAWSLIPKADYLPSGNRNLVFSFINAPPGANVDYMEKEMGNVVAETMAPYLAGEKEPQVLNYFFVTFPGRMFMGARTVDPDRAGELVPLINGVIRSFPDSIGFAFKTSLFGGLAGGRSIEIDIQGRDIEALLHAAGAGFFAATQTFGSTPRPFPGLDLADPELRLIPDERRIAEVGWSRSDVGSVVRALGDGLYVTDYFDGEQRLDVILRSRLWETPEALANVPLVTPDSGIVPLSDLVRLERTAGPDQLRRIDRRRTVTLQIRLPEGMSVEEGLDVIKAEVTPAIEAALPEDGDIRYSGSADKLSQALNNMVGVFLLAIAILYLLISALFRSFRDSLLVLFTIPLATVGGVVALWIMNAIGLRQPMDLLTMIGFVILLGLVVNNAILLVYQSRQAERDGLARRDAVEQAVRLRLRPILMTTLTSIFGMLPLLLVPGAGTELYRGLAAVIVGGMSVSTLFTLILLPSLLRIGEEGHRVKPVEAAVA